MDVKSVIKKAKGSPESLDIAMSLAHLTDTETYDISHILTHAKTKVSNLGHAQRQLDHIKGHAEDAAEVNKKLIQKLKKIPDVKQEIKELITERAKAS